MTSDIENSLASLRRRRGLAAAGLAKLAGVTRQTIYAIEAGSYVPNTAVALRLARALETTVEDLFALAGDAPAEPLRTEAELLPYSGPVQAGQPVQLCRVGKRLIASSPSPVQWYFPAADAVAAAKPRTKSRTAVQIFDPAGDFRNRLLIAGCDPGVSVLARHAQASGVELIIAHRNSSQALELLKEGRVHIAGAHLRDEKSGESNLPAVSRLFLRNAVAVISFAVWEEGIVMARGNPKSIHATEDLARKDVVIVNREPGAGSRALLDSLLRGIGAKPGSIRGYTNVAQGHLPAAWKVHSGSADACIATRGAARVFGLDFIPLISERYDFALRRKDLDLAAVQTLLDVLSRSRFRRELEGLGGYDTAVAGRRML